MEKKKIKQASKEYHRRYREKNIEKRRAWNREWIKNNKERYNASKYKYRDKTKLEAFLYYGEGVVACKFCGFKDIDALCLDHIDNNGAEHRRRMGISGRGTTGTNTYEALKREGYPQGLQILCANCNMIKELQRKRNNRLPNKFYEPNNRPV